MEERLMIYCGPIQGARLKYYLEQAILGESFYYAVAPKKPKGDSPSGEAMPEILTAIGQLTEAGWDRVLQVLVNILNQRMDRPNTRIVLRSRENRELAFMAGVSEEELADYLKFALEMAPVWKITLEEA